MLLVILGLRSNCLVARIYTESTWLLVLEQMLVQLDQHVQRLSQRLETVENSMEAAQVSVVEQERRVVVVVVPFTEECWSGWLQFALVVRWQIGEDVLWWLGLLRLLVVVRHAFLRLRSNICLILIFLLRDLELESLEG